MENNNQIEVPGFQYFMLPFLQVLADGTTKHMNEINELVIKNTEMTAEQCAVLLPSNSDTLVRNRIGWVRTYLFKAGLIVQVSRGNYHISEEGRRALKDNPNGINIKYLKTLAAFQNWGSSFSKYKEEHIEAEETDTKTPTERLESAFSTLIEEVAVELLDKVKNKKRLKHSSIEWIESKGILGSNWSQIPELLETIGLAYAISLLISIKPRLDC